MTEAAWNQLVDALGAEIAHLDSLREHADVGAQLMMDMDVPGIELWAARQAGILAELADLSTARTQALSACLPAGSTPGGSGGVTARMTLVAIIQLAPSWASRKLRSMRSRLAELRDEIALVTSRNEILVRQALQFTEELGRSLAAPANGPSAYDARGQVAAGSGGAGELLELSL